jgi:hypothetical protein
MRGNTSLPSSLCAASGGTHLHQTWQLGWLPGLCTESLPQEDSICWGFALIWEDALPSIWHRMLEVQRNESAEPRERVSLSMHGHCLSQCLH